jgi:hypothetical protein
VNENMTCEKLVTNREFYVHGNELQDTTRGKIIK